MTNKINYEIRKNKLIVIPIGDNIFSEFATEVYVEGDANNEFVIVKSQQEGYGKIAINPDEWETLKSAIDEIVKACRP